MGRPSLELEPAARAPAMTPPWWERLTPLANDCEIALELLHCTPGEYYARTTDAERLLMKLHLAYRNKQRAMAEQLAEARANTPPPLEPFHG